MAMYVYIHMFNDNVYVYVKMMHMYLHMHNDNVCMMTIDMYMSVSWSLCAMYV